MMHCSLGLGQSNFWGSVDDRLKAPVVSYHHVACVVYTQYY